MKFGMVHLLSEMCCIWYRAPDFPSVLLVGFSVLAVELVETHGQVDLGRIKKNRGNDAKTTRDLFSLPTVIIMRPSGAEVGRVCLWYW